MMRNRISTPSVLQSLAMVLVVLFGVVTIIGSGGGGGDDDDSTPDPAPAPEPTPGPSDITSLNFFNNLNCAGQDVTARFKICGIELYSTSGRWSGCVTTNPQTCNWEVLLSSATCGDITGSGSLALSPGCLYEFYLTLDGANVVVAYNQACPGDCSTQISSLESWAATVLETLDGYGTSFELNGD